MRLIDADALIEVLATMQGRCTTKAELIHNSKIWQQVKDMPTVDAEPVRHGKWIYGNDFHWYTASCSACGYQRRTDIKATRWNQWKYCPMCGTKMGDADGKAE